ncbi:MAG: PTS sugar transporter subunit IIA [Pseudomonadota bacterium]
MNIADLVTTSVVLPALRVGGKKQLFQELSARAAEAYGLDARRVASEVMAREQLGSTAMGGGVAIPHARIEGLETIVGVFARLDKPVEFDAADGRGVDLVFLLLAPLEAGADHLRALARVSRLMRTEACREKLRSTAKSDALYALLTEPDAASRAA